MSDKVVSIVFRHVNDGDIEDVVDSFADVFKFTDHGIGLEVSNKARLTEYFLKARDLYPDYVLQPVQTFVSGVHVIAQWTLHVTMTECFYGALARRTPVSFSGISIARIHNGKITDWADYYDGLTARRTALAAHFTEWIEY